MEEKPKKRWLRRILRSCGICFFVSVLGICAVYGVVCFLRPEPLKRKEIFEGVFYRCEELPRSELVRGRMVAIEVVLDTPDLEFFIRRPEISNDGPYYSLTLADWETVTGGLGVLVNTTRYMPETWYRSVPGARVESVESLVVEGAALWKRDNSYLLWLDKDLNPHLDTMKPTPDAVYEEAEWGIGLQGVQVWNENPVYQSMDDLDLVIHRTFIGIDPQKQVLWIIVFEAASGKFMIDKACELGVVHGGQVDSGNGTWLVIGKGANGVFPFTGIRAGRPISSFLGIRSRKIP